MKYKLSPLSLLNPVKVKQLLSFGIKGYLAEIGWFKAYETKMSVDEEGNPIPWVTYSFIDFIKSRIHKNHSIFEFGLGNSTLFYASKAKKVVSVEHNKIWFDKISASKPVNAEMIFCEVTVNGAYCRTPQTLSEKFNIIIVDGRDRINCCKNCLDALEEDGVIILDNTEREHYAEAFSFLESNGFRNISFTGISPGYFIKNSTTIFYKTNNCLGI